MPQFDLYKNPRAGQYPLLLDVQTDLLSQLSTRVVVPLAKLEKYPAARLKRLNPTVTTGGIEYVLVVPLLAAIPKVALGKSIGSLATSRTEIIAALDLLLTGT